MSNNSQKTASFFRQPHRAAAAACLVLSAALAACQPQTQTQQAAAHNTAAPAPKLDFAGTDVRDQNLGAAFTLQTTGGQTVSSGSLKGKVVALVFGYTHCPDVCPTNLLAYADALRQLGARAKEVQVVFITVDPERDTPDVTGRYAPAFDPSFIGLSADAAHRAAWQDTLRQYKIAYRKVSGSTPEQYLVDHSTGTYLLDRQGRTAVYEPHTQNATQLAHDLGLLLEQAQ